MDTISYLLDWLFYGFMVVGVVWAVQQIMHSKMHVLGKALTLAIGAYMFWAFWPHSGVSQGGWLIALGCVGMAVCVNAAVHKFHDWRVTSAIVAIALLVVVARAYPYFQAGPSAVAASLAPAVTATSPAVVAPSTPPARRSRTSPRASSHRAVPGLCDGLSETGREGLDCSQ